MLEKTVFTNETLVTELDERYGIKVTNIEKIDRGSANIYKVYDENNTYILKEFQSKYDKKEVDREIHIVNHLREDGLNVPQYIKMKNGDYSYVYGGKVVIVQKFIEGDVIDTNTCNDVQLEESATVLGKIVSSLETIDDLPEENISEWIDEDELSGAIEKFKALIEEASKMENTDQIIKDLKEKIEMIKGISKKIEKDILNITHKNSHGDYNVLQLIYREGKINAVIDFAAARKLPIVWEIIRSYSYMDEKCKNGELDINNLVEYTKTYMKYQDLTKVDLKYMPYVYLIQILTSSYGYKQYIKNGDEELLKFGFYRTNLARFLYNHAEEISNRLLNI